MAEFAAIPLYTDAWMADTDHLTRAERGLYMDLLILCWRSPNCRVPNDVEWISRKLKCTSDERAMLVQCISEFMSTTGNQLTQKRLQEEFLYCRDRRKKRSGAAKTRWDKVKAASNAYAEDMQKSTDAKHPSPSPSPSPSEVSPPNGGEVRVAAPAPTKGANGHAKKATRLPDGWEPLQEHVDKATREWGLTDDEVRWEHQKFTDYYQAKSGAKAVSLDWDRTWCNWMRKAADDKRNRQQRLSYPEKGKPQPFARR